MRFLIACLLFMSSVCWADPTPTPETFGSAETIAANETKSFTGKPAVIIERDTPTEPDINRAELIGAPTLIRPDLTIKTPYGHQRTAAYVDHTTDFAVMIHLLDDHSAHIDEIIQLITTTDMPTFQRTYPDKNTHILSVRENGKAIPYTFENGVLTTTQSLSAGFHQITVSYIVDYPQAQDNAITDITLPLVGTNWPLMTERFSVVLLLPKKGNIYTNELLFGTNNQSIPDDVLITKDNSGVITYQLTHPLPAFAEVKLHLTADRTIFPKSKMPFSNTQVLIMIYLAIVFGYTILSVITARLKKHTLVLKTVRKINPILWYLAIGRDLSALAVPSDQHKTASQPPLKIISFLRFNYEYIIGLGLLIILTVLFSRHTQTPISVWAMIIPAVIALIAIHFFGTRRELINLLDTLRHTLMDTPQGLNLPPREISFYFTIACIFGFGSLWEKQVKKHNPNYAHHFKEKDDSCGISH